MKTLAVIFYLTVAFTVRAQVLLRSVLYTSKGVIFGLHDSASNETKWAGLGEQVYGLKLNRYDLWYRKLIAERKEGEVALTFDQTCMFGGNYFPMTLPNEVDFDQLDYPMEIVSKADFVCPVELRNSGGFGNVSGYALVQGNGVPKEILVTTGSDCAFRDAAQSYASTWRFSMPKKDRSEVPVRVSFSFALVNGKIVGPFLYGNLPNRREGPFLFPSSDTRDGPDASTSASETAISK